MKLHHNSSRIEAFSDGVFAFAATLMVVNFNMDGNLEFNKASGVGFLSFAVSFFVLVSLWWVHYNFFRRNSYMDNWIILFNSILLFVALYYVFPLKTMVQSWMGEGGISSMNDLSNLFILYGIGFLLIFLCYSLMYFRAFKKTKSGKNSLLLYFYARHFGIFTMVSIVSILAALLELWIRIGFPGWIYGLIGPLCYGHAQWFSKKYPGIL
ncbi:TMEM175 family protein [Flagellimonas beolgyonensis]|uniref:TMEM175 family protein n=1 Tax=Flagellimonas beolgyonensis TaxID=864064 RepID=UPI003D64B668